MYLKEIKAQGFKSFADKISIELSNNITGIVGPNGSGKSNVVDAVRWVLGEQSVKSLRGTDNMTDVIFQGSKSRNSQNVASVTLVFDNKDKYLNIAYDEVAIKRRVYRDGTNEYFINNERCRLKDIIEIMLDTGIAKESFNIISQGKIEEILSNKPTDRRVIFEEAAGVLKYKKRKEEALRKLEKTNDNMSRVEDIIGELEIQVTPLKEQKEKALEYLDVKNSLENIEISLIAEDIKTMSNEFEIKKERKEKLKNEILEMNIKNSGNNAKLEELKNKLSKVNNEINIKNRMLLEQTTNVEKINSRKNILLERKKYEVEDTKLHQSLIDNKEKLLKLENDLVATDNEITLKNIRLTEVITKYKNQEKIIENIKNNKLKKDNELSYIYKQNINLKNRIDILRNNIETNGMLPVGVKKILGNPKLSGIHNVVGNIIEVDNEFRLAIETALGANSNNIVVDNELHAKEAIEYLKNNKLGRATFYPMNIIKERNIDISSIENMNGYIDVASNLVKYNPIYKNIISNQLGHIIICEDINSANYISRKINYKYRIVTIDGQVINVGGSMTGGANVNGKNTISLKYELEEQIKEQEKLENKIKNIEEEINEIDCKLAEENDKLYLINKDKIIEEETINRQNKVLEELNDLINDTKLQIGSINNMLNNSLSKEEDEIIKEYYKAEQEKELLMQNIKKLNDDANNIRDELETFEHSIKNDNTVFNSKNRELNNIEIEINRYDVKLDNLLNTLSETYNMTYEKAISEYILEEDVTTSRNKVNNLKKRLKEIGMVNINAIEEYDRVNERYEFLTNQKEDLLKAKETLLEIIKEMDDVMKEEFTKTFRLIKENFTLTFKELFKGGTATLELTDPENILETGIDIIASPPGKKLSNISLLSGGEKTFTAISLLFAILKSRPVPFCILDEVEAALDDANVNSFGLYLKNLQEKTQFILITHKKRTMEFVDTLYGITMQESGVSKLVSVKLEEVK
ncbi:MAG: AAA family ATPase [Bacilli bacterium]|jgi:chromosome segregation protein|nr:AAA family ATPase [Bacilli bacterium]